MRRIFGIALSLWLASIWGQVMAAGGLGGVIPPVNNQPPIFTMTVVNDSASADNCTNTTNCMPLQDQGIWFPDNTICNGQAPVFKVGGQVQKFSYGLLTYWGWSGQGYISGTTLTVTSTTSGGIGIGETINGASAGTTVTAFNGFVSNQPVYTVSQSQTLGSAGSPVSLTVGGCLRGGTFRIARTFSVAGSTTQNISVLGGGSWPSASARTITDAYNQNLITTVCAAGITCAGTGTAVSGANIDGVWTFNLQADANNYRVTKWMTGDAGEGWKVSSHMVETFTANTHGNTTLDTIVFNDGKTTAVLTNGQTINCTQDVSNLTITIASSTSLTLSSAAGGTHAVTCTVQHGQLRFDAYVDVFNNSSGGLGAFRWDGAVRQPAYNSDIPAKNFRAFATPVYSSNGTVTNGPNWQVCGAVGGCVAAPGNQSGAIPLSFGGSDGNPIVGQATTVSGGVMSTTASNNWWYGSPWTDDGNYTAGYFTGSPVASSPQVDTSHIYWVLSNQQNSSGYSASSAFTSVHLSGPGGGSQASGITFSGSGANGTFNPVPVVEPGTRIWFVSSSAKPNFFQGTGTITAETTLRVEINQAYLVSTHAILPYDLSISGSAKGGSVHTSYFFEPTPNYNPWVFGHLFGHQQAGGDHPDLGPYPDDAAVAFYNDTVTDDFVVRVDGLSAGNSPADFKDIGTDTILDLLGTNGSASSYTGFPNSVSTSVVVASGYGVGACGGYTCPPQPDWSTTFLNIDGSHKPQYTSFAYVKTGRLEFLDMNVEQAQWGLLVDVSITNRNPTDAATSATVRGIQTAFCCDPRGQAWDHRDIQQAAGYYPFDPTGTATTYGCSNVACSGGSDIAIGKYLDKWARNNTAFMHHQLDPANAAYGSQTTFVAGCSSGPATPCTSSGYAFNNLGGANIDSGRTTLGVFVDFGGEESNYQIWAYLFSAMLRNDPEAIQVLNYWISGQKSLFSQVGGYNVYSFVNHISVNDTNSFGKPPIGDLGHFTQKIEGGPFGAATLQWATTSPAFDVKNLNGQPFANGDIFMFCGSPEATDNGNCATTPPSNFTAYEAYYVANVTAVSVGVEYTFDLKPCSSIAANGTCNTLGSVILPGSSQSAFGLVGWYRMTSPPGTGAMNSFSGGEGPASAYYGAYMMYKFLFGTNNSVGPLLTDILARLATDSWSPATGSAFSGVSNPGGYQPRYSEHY